MDAATQRALAGIPTATPDGPAGTAVRAYLAEQSRAFLTQNAAPSRLRAACRRTSSALAACRALVDPAWADDLGDEVDRTAAVLAAERDADAVRRRLLAPLDTWITEGRYPDGGAARTRTLLARMLDRDRSAAHSSATAALVGPHFHALADKMATLAREAPLTPVADRSCAEVLPAVVTAAYENLLRRVAALPEPLESEDAGADEQWFAAYQAAETALHTAELCRPAEVSVPGREADDLVEGLTRVAQALRDQEDAVRAAACVHRAADTPRIAATTGYVLGRLHEEQRLAVLRARCAAPWEVLAVPVPVPAQGQGTSAARPVASAPVGGPGAASWSSAAVPGGGREDAAPAAPGRGAGPAVGPTPPADRASGTPSAITPTPTTATTATTATATDRQRTRPAQAAQLTAQPHRTPPEGAPQ